MINFVNTANVEPIFAPGSDLIELILARAMCEGKECFVENFVASLANCGNLRTIDTSAIYVYATQNNMSAFLNRYVPSLESFISNYSYGRPHWYNFEGLEYFSNLKELNVNWGTGDNFDFTALKNLLCLEKLRMTTMDEFSLDAFKALNDGQNERNTILSGIEGNKVESEKWKNSKYYKDLAGKLTGDSGEIHWLENLTLSNCHVKDIWYIQYLTHLTSLDLSNNVGIGDTFEHEGLESSPKTAEFLNDLAENCFKNTGKKLTVNLKGTSITTITKNKINTDYCILQCDV